MLVSEAKRVREQKVRKMKGLYKKLCDYINHSYLDVIDGAAKSDNHRHINDIHDRLEKALHVLRDPSGLLPDEEQRSAFTKQ